METGILPFAECLREIIAARGWSLDALAGMTGYKSRTSVARLLQEQSSQKNRQRFFKRLCDSGALTQTEEKRLRAALDVSLIGMDKAIARGVFKELIVGSGAKEANSPNFERLLELLRGAERARILMVNCLYEPLFVALRDLLLENPNCTLRHYFILDEGESQAAQAMYCLSRMTYLPNFCACACERGKRNAGMLVGLNFLCATVEGGDGATDVFALLSENYRVALHRLPAEDGLFSFLERVLTQAMASADAVTRFCSTDNGPQSFIDIMQFWEETERNRDMYHVKSDLCVNNIPTQHLRACLNERDLLRFFPELDVETLRRMIDTLLYFQRLRYKNMYESKNPKHFILTMSGLRRFAQTGMTTEHFAAMRPFTVRERVVILEDLLTNAEENPHFYLYLFREDFEPAYEINCWDGLGMTAFPIVKQQETVDNYCNNVICHPRMVTAFRDYFMDDLRVEHTLTAPERSAFLRGLIEGLKAQRPQSRKEPGERA